MAKTWMAYDREVIDSYSRIGEQTYTILRAFDGWDFWWPNATEVHWFIMDLLQSYTLTKIRGRSNYPGWNPINVNVYVSDDKENFGDAVAAGISTWKDTDAYVEINLVEKNGRYVKVEVIGTEQGTPGDMAWGKAAAPFKIIELFGEVAPLTYPVNRLRKDVIHGYNCFIDAYVKALIGDFVPLKLPDGTVF